MKWDVRIWTGLSWRREKACTGFWWGNLRERDHWGDPGVDGRIKVEYRVRVGGSNPPLPNSQYREKYIHNNLISIGVSLILKLSGTPD
jgi:hypothetical protein